MKQKRHTECVKRKRPPTEATSKAARPADEAGNFWSGEGKQVAPECTLQVPCRQVTTLKC